jgi:hypothetical protein
MIAQRPPDEADSGVASRRWAESRRVSTHSIRWIDGELAHVEADDAKLDALF